ncbi:hypothetical protein [Microbacterium sp. P04]|uniref:hypothetical protein n=1 Tax=Microbacterium sp. P04 TaxID=3366947 RepID=UPI0037471EB9
MAQPAEHGGPLPPPLAVVFATVTFFALAIAGLGFTSLFLDADVIAVEGLGQAPGIVGMIGAGLVFAASLLLAVRTQHPSFWSAPITALATVLAYAAGVLFGGALSGADLAASAVAAGTAMVGWVGIVLFLAALVSAAGGVALVRSRGGTPRWRWERDDDAE